MEYTIISFAIVSIIHLHSKFLGWAIFSHFLLNNYFWLHLIIWLFQLIFYTYRFSQSKNLNYHWSCMQLWTGRIEFNGFHWIPWGWHLDQYSYMRQHRLHIIFHIHNLKYLTSSQNISIRGDNFKRSWFISVSWNQVVQVMVMVRIALTVISKWHNSLHRNSKHASPSTY